MKLFNKLKKIKLTRFQIVLIIILILLIVMTNLFCNTLGLGKNCNLKEGYLIDDDEAGGTMDHSHTGYVDGHSLWHGWLDEEGNNTTLLSLSNVNAQDIGYALDSKPATGTTI